MNKSEEVVFSTDKAKIPPINYLKVFISGEVGAFDVDRVMLAVFDSLESAHSYIVNTEGKKLRHVLSIQDFLQVEDM